MTHETMFVSTKRFAGLSLRCILALFAIAGGGIVAHAQQKPKRNAEVIVTLDACAPNVTYQPTFPNNNNGTLNLYIWETGPGTYVTNETWNGDPAGGNTHTGIRHIKLQPYRDYSVTLTRLGQPMEWGEIKLSAPAGYAVFINGVARESFRVIPQDLTNGIFSFTVREVGDGGLLPAGMALPPDVADFVWTMSTGTYANGLPLTPVQLRGQSLAASMLSPKALTFLHPYSPEVGAVLHSDGGLHEIDTFQAIYYFRRGAPAGGYTIEVYSPWATRTGTGDGPYTYSELPYREFRVSNPDGATWNNRIRIEKVDREGTTTTSETWTVTQSGSDWTVVETSSLRTVTRVSSPSGGNRVETITVADNAQTPNIATKVRRVFQTKPWGQEELIEETTNPDATNGPALTTQYAYHESQGTGGYSRLKSVTAPDGTWVAYNYDNSLAGLGNLVEVLRPWQGTPASAEAATAANSLATTLSYASERGIFLDLPAGMETKITGTSTARETVEIASSGNAPNGQPLRSVTTKKYWDGGQNSYLQSVMEVYNPLSASPEFRGRPYSVVNSDGTKTSYLRYQAYFWNYNDNNATLLKKWPGNPAADTTWGEYRFNGFSTQVEDAVLVNSWDGQSFSPVYMVPNRSTVELVIYSGEGRPWFTVTYVFTSAGGAVAGFEFLSMTETGYDTGLQMATRSLTGFWEQKAFLGDKLSGVTSNDGSYVEYSRDALGRATMERKFGMSASGDYPAQDTIYTHRTFDAANRVLTEKVSNSANPADAGIGTSQIYDLSGLVRSATDATGLTTTATYANGGRTVTITMPTGTRKVDRHPLGTLISGSTVVPEFSRVVHNSSNGTLQQESYVLTPASLAAVEAALSGNSLTNLNTALATVPRWQKVEFDRLGRRTKETRPAPPGASPTTLTKQYHYNTIGQLTKVSETGLADSLIEYNAWQQPYRTGLDLSSGGEITPTANTPNGVLDLNSKDRITETSSFFEKDGNGAWWAVGTSWQYAAIGSTSSTTPTTTKTRLNKYSDHGRLGSGYVQSETVVTDIFRNLTRKTVAVQRGTSYFETNLKLVTVTIDLPNSSTDEVAAARNGLLQTRQSSEGLLYRNYYDGLGRLVKTTDPRTDTTSTPRIGYYDGTAALGNRHQVAWREDTAGKRTSYAYSTTTGQLFSETNPLSKAVYHDYNARGQERRTWGAATQPVEYGFNDYGERTTMRTWRDATGAEDFTLSTWGGSSYPSTTGDVTTWAYDPATGLLLSKTVPAADPGSTDNVRKTAQTVSYTYNVRGQLKTRTWARGIVTSYSYYGEAAGEPKTSELRFVDYPTGGNTTDILYTYNRQALPETIADATGARSFEYCECGKPLYELFDATYFGGRKLTYKNDDSTAGALGRTFGYTVELGTTTEQDITYGFDTYGRFNKLTDTRTTPDTSAVFDYAYTGNSNLLASITNTASGWTQTRTYETSRDVLDIIETKVGVSTKAKFDYTVDDLRRRTDVSKTGEMFSRYGAAGLDTHWDYNDRSEVTNEEMRLGGTLNALPGRSLGFNYDFIGNRKTATVDGRPLTYARNAVNQYDTVAGRTFSDVTGLAPSASTVYINNTAVPASNRKGDYFFAAVSPTNLPAWQDAVVALTAGGNDATRKLFLPQNPEPMAYDADGNLTSDGRWNYVYDAENRLISVETKPNLLNPTGPMLAVDAKRLEFTYDYMGRRVEKVVRSGFNGTTYATETRTRFIYEGWNLATEYTTTISGSTTTLTLAKTYTWGLDWSGTRQGAGGVGGLLLVTEKPSGLKHLPAYDGNGNVMGLVNTTGGFTAIYEYDAFGQTIRAEGTYAAANPFRFSTKFTDTETGLVYYGLRYYSPSLGRFVNRDPIEEQGGLNLYAFVRNNSLNAWDYLGMDAGKVDPDTLKNTEDKIRFTGRIIEIGDGVYAEVVIGNHTTQILVGYKSGSNTGVQGYIEWHNSGTRGGDGSDSGGSAGDKVVVLEPHVTTADRVPDIQVTPDNVPERTTSTPATGTGGAVAPNNAQLSKSDCDALAAKINNNVATLNRIATTQGENLNSGAFNSLRSMWDAIGYPAELTGYAEGIYANGYRLAKMALDASGNRSWRKSITGAYKSAAPTVKVVGGVLTALDVIQLGVDIEDRDGQMFLSHSAEMGLGLMQLTPGMNLVVMGSRYVIRDQLGKLQGDVDKMDATGAAAYNQETSRNVAIGTRNVNQWQKEWNDGGCARFNK